MTIDESEFDRRHRPGVPQDRQGGPAARLPCRQGPTPCARGPHRRSRPAREQALQRRDPAVPREGGPRARRRPHRHARGRGHERRGGGPGRLRRHVRGASRDHRPRLRRAARRAAQPGGDRRRGRGGDRRPSSSATASSSTSSGRPPRGDYVTLDLDGTRDGEPVTGLNTEDWSYEIGQGWVADDFDDQLVGASAGAELTFTTTPKGTPEPADFAITVSARPGAGRCPSSTDEWVADNLGEFDTVAEWTAQHPPSDISATQAEPGPQRAHRPRHRGAHRRSPRSRRPSRWSTATCSAGSRAPCASSSPRASNMEQFFAATGQDATGFVESAEGPVRAGGQGRPRAARRRRRRGARRRRRRPRRRVRAHRHAGEPEAEPGAQGVREQRPGARPEAQIRKSQGARLAAPPRGDGRPRRRTRSTATSCSATATTHDATTTTTTTTTTRPRRRHPTDDDARPSHADAPIPPPPRARR